MSVENPHGEGRHRLVVEAIFYMVLVVIFLPYFIRIAGRQLFGGGLMALAGLVILSIYLYDKLPAPQAFKYIVIINVLANLFLTFGQGVSPVIGPGLGPLVHWVSLVLIISYLCRSQNVEDRMLLAASTAILLSLALSGSAPWSYGEDRLILERDGDRFLNSNDLAYTAGIFSIAMLGRSFRAGAFFVFTSLMTDTLKLLRCQTKDFSCLMVGRTSLWIYQRA